MLKSAKITKICGRKNITMNQNRATCLMLFIAQILLFSCSQQKETANEVESRVENLPFFNEASFLPKWIIPEIRKEIRFPRKALKVKSTSLISSSRVAREFVLR
jgi:hypothetical protein